MGEMTCDIVGTIANVYPPEVSRGGVTYQVFTMGVDMNRSSDIKWQKCTLWGSKVTRYKDMLSYTGLVRVEGTAAFFRTDDGDERLSIEVNHITTAEE